MTPTLAFWIGVGVGLLAFLAVLLVASRVMDPADELIITTHTESPGEGFYLVGLVSGRETANSRLAGRLGDAVRSVHEESIVLTDGRTAHPGDCIWRAFPEPYWP